MRDSGAVALSAVCVFTTLQAPPEREVATRAYFVGTSAEVRQIIKESTNPHRTVLGDHKRTADYGKVPPACGLRVRTAFAAFSEKELSVGLTPCNASENRVECSTDYLNPRSDRVYWRVRYRRSEEQASLELQVLARADGGRTSEVVAPKSFDTLYQQLLKVSRCDDR